MSSWQGRLMRLFDRLAPVILIVFSLTWLILALHQFQGASQRALTHPTSLEPSPNTSWKISKPRTFR